MQLNIPAYMHETAKCKEYKPMRYRDLSNKNTIYYWSRVFANVYVYINILDNYCLEMLKIFASVVQKVVSLSSDCKCQRCLSGALVRVSSQ